jgi:thymidylate synthase
MPTIISAADEVEAWRSGVERLVASRGEIFHLVTEINKPGALQARGLHVYDGRNVPSGKDTVAGVATTICPYRFYPNSANRTAFYARSVAFLRRLRHRGLLSSNWGATYFERLIAFQGRENQLETAIEKMNQWTRSSRTGLVFHLSAPTLDAPRTRGGPCLQFIELLWHKNGAVDLAAVYRNHDFIDKALGNFVGLADLQRFICSETGKQVGRLVCHSMRASVSNLGDARTLAKI